MNVVPKVEAAPDVTAAAGPCAGTQLPLISFIVVNYNYGRFLRQCVDSIFAQTYPVVECIVVDNKSTDESSQVIADLQEIYPQLGVIYERANLGQSAACVDGYNKSSGQFVVFVDADDYYFETFAETHFLVHLSLRHAVGFTSSDMVQVVNGSIVLGTIFEAAGAADPAHLKKIDLETLWTLPEECGVGSASRLGIEKLSLRLAPHWVTRWVWAPTSSTVYRRDALALFVDCVTLPSLRCATDAFFNYAINAFTGSVLIDAPLAAYRIHGDNLFSGHASLNNLRCFAPKMDQGALAAKLALEHIVANLHRFDVKSNSPRQLKEAMKNLQRKAVGRRLQGDRALKFRAFVVELERLYWKIKIKML